MSARPNHITITVRGAKGAGKSSTAQFIAKALRDAGVDVSLYETDSGRRVLQEIIGSVSRSKFVSVVVRQES